jgi:hypothetical protein
VYRVDCRACGIVKFFNQTGPTEPFQCGMKMQFS